MPNKEFRFLMNNKSEMTLQDLKDLLIDNEVQNFDPIAEAFKVYDPHGTGFIDSEILRSIFQNLGFGDISDEDLGILIETGDMDKDGKISLEDFRKMADGGVNGKVGSGDKEKPTVDNNEKSKEGGADPQKEPPQPDEE